MKRAQWGRRVVIMVTDARRSKPIAGFHMTSLKFKLQNY